VFLVQMWRYLGPGPQARAVMVIFGAAAVVFLTLILSYFLFPHRHGPYGKYLIGASLGGLTAMNLTMPVFVPLIEVQMRLIEKTMDAMNLPLINQWNEIMVPCGSCIEIVLIGMAAGWLFVIVHSWLKAKRLADS
jgi:hypothetical protein